MRLRSIDREVGEVERAGLPPYYRRRSRLGLASLGVAAVGVGTAFLSLLIPVANGDIPLGISHDDPDEEAQPSGPGAWFIPTIITSSSVAVVGLIVSAWAFVSRNHPNSNTARIAELLQLRSQVIQDFKQAQREGRRLELLPGAGLGQVPGASWSLRVRF